MIKAAVSFCSDIVLSVLLSGPISKTFCLLVFVIVGIALVLIVVIVLPFEDL